MQSKKMSFVEAKTNAVVGLLVSWLFTYLCLPLFGFKPSVLDATWITGCYFFLSFARSYILRRAFVMVERGNATSTNRSSHRTS